MDFTNPMIDSFDIFMSIYIIIIFNESQWISTGTYVSMPTS